MLNFPMFQQRLRDIKDLCDGMSEDQIQTVVEELCDIPEVTQ